VRYQTELLLMVVFLNVTTAETKTGDLLTNTLRELFQQLKIRKEFKKRGDRLAASFTG
jgi:hypothetical protein